VTAVSGSHPRYQGPVVDVHVHYDAASREHAARVGEIGGLRSAISLWDVVWPPRPYEEDLAGWRAHEPRLLRCFVPDPSRVGEAGFANEVEHDIHAAAGAGCVGMKVWKNLGLWLTDERERRIAVDDERLDPMWAAAGDAGLPVLIHVGDPPEFWQPLTPDNPRYDDIKDRPEWWYGNGGFPKLEAIQAQLEAVVARHPRTTFIGAHFGCFLSVDELRRWFAAYPNYNVDTAAAIAEMGKGDVTPVRDLVLDHPDRVLFGTDLARTPAFEYPDFGERRWDLTEYFDRHWRFFETADTSLAHPIPEQLPWTVTGLDLPSDVLAALYHDNAARLYRLPAQATIDSTVT
jgi:predicted TIM-barrel fold metal-dependent hydrolase